MWKRVRLQYRDICHQKNSLKEILTEWSKVQSRIQIIPLIHYRSKNPIHASHSKVDSCVIVIDRSNIYFLAYDTINQLCRRIDTRIWIDWPEKLKNRLNRMLDRISLESSRVLDGSRKSVKTLTMPGSCRLRFYLLLLCRFSGIGYRYKIGILLCISFVKIIERGFYGRTYMQK